eukprot:1159849-Pelagomonas_calceolata.AAC.4
MQQLYPRMRTHTSLVSQSVLKNCDIWAPREGRVVGRGCVHGVTSTCMFCLTSAFVCVLDHNQHSWHVKSVAAQQFFKSQAEAAHRLQITVNCLKAVCRRTGGYNERSPDLLLYALEYAASALSALNCSQLLFLALL